MKRLRRSRLCLTATLLAASLASAQTGIREKKPVFGGTCRLCP
jgi:hypothetical protein